MIKRYRLDPTGMQEKATHLDLQAQVHQLCGPNPGLYTFYRSYVQKARHILQPLCGVGTFLLPFLKEGFPIQGFDDRPHWLAQLKENTLFKDLNPFVWQQKLEDFCKNTAYDLIILPDASFGNLVQTQNIQTTLQNLYKSLQVGGSLVFDVQTIHNVPRPGTLHQSHWMTPQGQKICLSFYSCLTGSIGTSIRKYELLDKQKVLQTEVYEIQYRIYDAQEILDLLQQAGFCHAKIVQNSQNQKIIENRLICQATKEG